MKLQGIIILNFLLASSALKTARRGTATNTNRNRQTWTTPAASISVWQDLCPISALPESGSCGLLRPQPELPVVVAVDNIGDVHVLYDIVPCVGHRLSDWGVVDGQVQVVLDRVTRRKYYLADGTVRGAKTARGPLWDTTGLAGAAIRIFLRPRPVPLEVLHWRRFDSNATNTTEASGAEASGAGHDGEGKAVLQIQVESIAGVRPENGCQVGPVRKVARRLLPRPPLP